jgi:hypothetical protein
MMTGSARSGLKSAKKEKRLHGANKIPYIDRGLVCARQELTTNL